MICVFYYMTGTSEGSPKVVLWRRQEIEPATPGLQGIGLSPTPRRLLYKYMGESSNFLKILNLTNSNLKTSNMPINH